MKIRIYEALVTTFLWIEVESQFTVHKSSTNNCWQDKALIQPDLEWIEEAVERHNYYRALHNAPPLTLNLQLCQISQAWANERARGVQGHNPKRCRLGENILTVSTNGRLEERNGSVAVDDWYNEEPFYDYSTGKQKPDHLKQPVGHFTQVVWNSTREMGIGATKYYKLHGDGQNWEYLVIVANYYPPGNSPNFQENVAQKSSGKTVQFQTASNFLVQISICFVAIFLVGSY